MTIEEQALDLEKMLKGRKKVTVISHYNPDGDAVGSSMGMYGYLKAHGHQADVVLPSVKPAFLDFLDPENTIIYYSEDKERAKAAINGCDLIICLDFNRLSRTEWLEETLAAATADKVMIDHHLNPEKERFSIVISDPAASSTCEMLYRTLMAFSSVGGDPRKLDLTTLTAITAGILTDTNNFNNSLTPYTFTIASDMLRSGVDFDFLNNMLFKRFSESRMRLMGHLLKESMLIDRETGSSCMILTMEDKKKFGMEDGDSDGFVNLPLMIKDVEVSALFTETEDFIKVSLRSKGLSVNALSKEFFNGGGHIRAAGGRLYIPIGEVREYFRKSLEQFLQNNRQK